MQNSDRNTVKHGVGGGDRLCGFAILSFARHKDIV